MASPSSLSFTLDTLPCDIVRIIIRSNAGEDKNNLRLISREWDVLVVEYLKTLPLIDWMRVIDWSDNQVGAIMLAERKHWSHFRSVIPENWEEIHDEESSATLIKINFRFPPEKGDKTLSRLFYSMKGIDELSLWDLNEKMLDIIRFKARKIKIGELEVKHADLSQNEIRKKIMKIVQHHNIESFYITVRTISDTKLNTLLCSIPHSVVYVCMTSNSSITGHSKSLWKSYAQKIMKKGSVKEMLLRSREIDIFYECDPIFSFMLDFQYVI